MWQAVSALLENRPQKPPCAPVNFSPIPPREDEASDLELAAPETQSAAAADQLANTLDGIALAIGYQDASGHFSRRIVKIIKLTTSKTGLIYLNCICHSAKAFRQFRWDRIRECITQDGEVLEPLQFFRTVLMVDIDAMMRMADDPDPLAEAWLWARRQLAPEIRLMIALARADDH